MTSLSTWVKVSSDYNNVCGKREAISVAEVSKLFVTCLLFHSCRNRIWLFTWRMVRGESQLIPDSPRQSRILWKPFSDLNQILLLTQRIRFYKEFWVLNANKEILQVDQQLLKNSFKISVFFRGEKIYVYVNCFP